MDLLKGDSYVSCIKIRGVPIIPPLMTEDIRAEMRYYKGLAVAVEERLARLERSASLCVHDDTIGTASTSIGEYGLFRATESLEGQRDGQTDYPDETGPCGSESPGLTTGSGDLTASTDVDRYLDDLSLGAERSRAESAEKSRTESAEKSETGSAEEGAQSSIDKSAERSKELKAPASAEYVTAQESVPCMKLQHRGKDTIIQQGAEETKFPQTVDYNEAQQTAEKIIAQPSIEYIRVRDAECMETPQCTGKIEVQQSTVFDIARSGEQKAEYGAALEAEQNARQRIERSAAYGAALNAGQGAALNAGQGAALNAGQGAALNAGQSAAQSTVPNDAIQALNSKQGAELSVVLHAEQCTSQNPVLGGEQATAHSIASASQHGTQCAAKAERDAPECRRVPVPNSLRIVPIILPAAPGSHTDARVRRESGASMSLTETDETTPKLVRQGSYVLETPSPVLLAKMRQESDDSPLEYAPSSRDTPQRRAWNISEAKSSWDFQNGTVTSWSKGHRIGGSVDCIRSFVDREGTSRVSKTLGKSSAPGDGRRSINKKTTSILSMANKLGGSLGNLGTLRRQRTPGSRVTRSVNDDDVVRDNIRTKKLLASVTTDKILEVFEHIRNAHERQMSQLAARQRREQRDMQREFERQRFILVGQIERTFPGIKLPELASKIVESSTSPEIDGNDAKGNPIIVESPKINGFSPKGDRDPTRCPLNGILPCQEQEIPSPRRHLDETMRRDDLRASRRLFPVDDKSGAYDERHVKAATIINAYTRGYLVRRIMRTEKVLALKMTYGEALRYMLRLHVDAPLALPELNFHQRLQLQCDAASMNIVELFALEPARRMEIIRQDRQMKRARRQERPNSARSCYSFATQRTLARKKLKEMGDFQTPISGRSIVARSRCQTWTSNAREKRSPSVINQGIKRSTSAGAVRKPWR